MKHTPSEFSFQCHKTGIKKACILCVGKINIIRLAELFTKLSLSTFYWVGKFYESNKKYWKQINHDFCRLSNMLDCLYKKKADYARNGKLFAKKKKKILWSLGWWWKTLEANVVQGEYQQMVDYDMEDQLQFGLDVSFALIIFQGWDFLEMLKENLNALKFFSFTGPQLS